MAFLYGLVALAVVLFLLRHLTSANPARVGQVVRRVGGVVALLLGALLILRGGAAIGAPLAAFGAMLLGVNQIPGFPYAAGQGPSAGGLAGGSGASTGTGGGAGQPSQVRTAWLDMRLDRQSGHMDGIVLRGEAQGKLLSELDVPEVVALWQRCRGDDALSAQLLEAYLDWREADWRRLYGEEQARASAREEDHGAMSREEALAILGLAPGASAQEIRQAHRNLMKHVHPDHGGSSYLAAKINAAKEVLLKA